MSDRTGHSLRYALAASFFLIGLSGCDLIQQKLGIEDPAAKATKLDAEGRAVGGACRQSGRAIEDCYAIYSWLPKASIYEGWRDMDAYMRDNKLETVEPQLPPPLPPGVKRKATATKDEPTAAATTPTTAKPADKH